MNQSTLRSALRRSYLTACSVPFLLVAACNSGAGGDGGMVGEVGAELQKPDGSGSFFNDANEGGTASSLKLLSTSWGRLVDVHDIDASTGDVDPAPIFRDFVINETVQSDGLNYLLETNPVTEKTRLVILREKDDTNPVDAFTALLKDASDDLSPVLAKSDDPATLPPFSFVARNSALVLRFNDLLDDSAAGVLALPETVRVLTDYPPALPYQNKRLIFDPNHGGLSGGEFHSTRVVIDLTVSEAEAATMAVPTGLNSLGLPPSLTTTQQANVGLRIPSTVNELAGQFSVLQNLSGKGLSTSGNGPVDFGSATLDVVRAMRSGNSVDDNNGFLLDLNPPELVSGWPITVLNVADNPGGDSGFDFLLDVRFDSPCQAQPEPGNIIELPGRFVEVSALGLPPDLSGLVSGIEVRSLADTPIQSAELLGGALFQRTFDASLLPSSLEACWISYTPLPGAFPAAEIDPNSEIVLRFSEPMDPSTVTPFDSFRVQTVGAIPSPSDIVVGEVTPSGDLKEFTYTPILPFNHTEATTESYFVSLLGEDGITDLAGNSPQGVPATIEFTLDPDAPTLRNGGIVLTLSSLDEVVRIDLNEPGDGAWEDWRGQFLFDPERGVIKPRPLVRTAAVADRSQAVPGLMTAFAPGVQTPLSPLGSKMMTLWRYCDVGFSSQDENNFNLDVEGLSWSPIGGQLVSDFYPEFEIRLSHSHFLPDESLNAALLPDHPNSGLSKSSYATNILIDPESPQKVVHPQTSGYILNPVELFLSSTGTFMFPYPLNRETAAADDEYYTWRDTAILAKAGPNNNGMDLDIMGDAGLVPVPPPGGGTVPGQPGYYAQTNQVPSLGLPLLMEFRCYPAEESIGLNAFDISLAINTSRIPAFRVFSTGGFDVNQTPQTVDPDLFPVPTGGYNPNSTPPGGTTPPEDNTFYIGQMDIITRISRVHSIWLDTEQSGGVTDFVDPVVEPAADAQPAGTELVFAYRGASQIGGVSATVGQAFAFRAEYIDPYGDIRNFDAAAFSPEFIGSLAADVTYLPAGDTTWHEDIDDLDGARLFQIRTTFIGNTTTLLNPEFSAIGVAWIVNN